MGPIDPKDKAKELIKKMDEEFAWAIDYGRTDAIAKNLALICVDEILKAGNEYIVNQYFDDRYWQQVKEEINKL